MEILTAYENALLAQMAYANKLNDSKSGVSLEIALMHSEFGAKDVTQAQAEYFASKYVVVQQTNNPNTGFSATLFQVIETGEYHLATRGSAGNLSDPDWTDANVTNNKFGMAYNQVADLLNFYLRLTHPSNETVAQFSFKEELLAPDAPPPSQPHVVIGTEFVSPEISWIKYAVFSEADPAEGLGAINDTQQLTLTGHSLGGHLASAFTLLFPTVTSSTVNNNGVIEPQRQAA